MTPVTLLLIFFVAFLYYQYIIKSWPKNFPNGIPRLPFGGHYFLLRLMNYNTVHEPLQRISKWFKSNLVGFHLFDYRCIVASGQESVREVLLRPEFQGRMDIFPARLRGLGDRRGLFNNDGPVLFEQRRFMLRCLREFGFGCRNANEEALLIRESQDIVDKINSFKGKEGIVLPDIYFPHALNNIWSMVAGIRFPPEAHDSLMELCRGIADNVNLLDLSGNIITYLPWTRYFIPNVSNYKPLVKGQNILRDFVREEIKQHKENHIPGVHNDFIDFYLDRLKEEIESGKLTSFSEPELVVILMDLLLPPVQTIPNVMGFLAVCLLNNPENQLKAQAEIDRVVGRNRLPTLDDRKNLPFVESLIREVLRFSTPNPLGIIRVVTEDTVMQGYDLKKGTVLAPNLEGMHLDPDLWKNPHEFYPERMIGENGFVDLKADKSLPFGHGRRVCAGETFARQTMFVMAAGLLQNFTLWPLDPIPDYKKYKTGGTKYVDPFRIKAVPRL